MTITEKILAAHCGKSEVRPGELIWAEVDLALGNDITAPIAIELFHKSGAKKVFHRDKIALVPDHFTPSKDIKSAENARLLREFAREQALKNYFEVGRAGIEHALLPELGLVLPGQLIIGADSHTCTYGGIGAFATGVGSTDFAAAMVAGKVWLKVPESMRIVYSGGLRPWVGGKDLILYTIGKIGVDGALYKAMEFCGETIDLLPVEGRLTMANMAIEAGAKNGIFAPDQRTIDFVRSTPACNQLGPGSDLLLPHSDPDAHYCKELLFLAGDIEPQVAFPFLPDNTRPISQAGHVGIDQVVIGSCTNGWLSDLRQAAAVLRGKKVAKGVRLIVVPATPKIYKDALAEGLIEVFIDAGAAVSTPTCGPCLGGHMGVLAAGERCVATTNRNFVGRMGHPKSEVYLANPAVAAASAVKGAIAAPEEVIS